MAALAALDELISGGGVSFACPAPSGGGMGASFGLDGSAFVRFTSVEALVASDGQASLSRFGLRLAAARDTLSTLNACLDAVVALVVLAGAAVAAAGGAGGWAAAIRAALVLGAYAALLPLRTVLIRLVLRSAMRLALRASRRRPSG